MATMGGVQIEQVRRPMVYRVVNAAKTYDGVVLVQAIASDNRSTDRDVWNGDWTWAGLRLLLRWSRS